VEIVRLDDISIGRRERESKNESQRGEKVNQGHSLENIIFRRLGSSEGTIKMNEKKRKMIRKPR
jgi:hypothetical protein